jgi:hypothetical protein
MNPTTRARLDVAVDCTLRELERGRVPREALQELVFEALRIQNLEKPNDFPPPPAPGPWDDEITEVKVG